MSVWHYDETPLPVGLPINMNGSDLSYQLGLFDGATHSEQYPDEPEAGVLFESPDGAAAWLASVTAVLAPYIEAGNRDARIPNPDGWTEWEGDE